jgi:hypothetical protein
MFDIKIWDTYLCALSTFTSQLLYFFFAIGFARKNLTFHGESTLLSIPGMDAVHQERDTRR